ncbi:MAG TPA: tetrahydrofolate dehydrogenase/cyclohydrolase catalytic domain-containing protein [Nevskiaceae bacterium]|nr:tetrahydrofolate dehydrogenase/cyclohydrolase catalytic domain-containing protein [Nevskiaceae bacterium]
MVKIIDGRKLALIKEKKLAREVANFKKTSGISPKLVSIFIGDPPIRRASQLYVNLKEKTAKRVGILFEKKAFSANKDPKVIYEYIKKKNIDRGVSGIMIQLPLPPKIDPFWLVSKIDPEKDVDCLTPENLGLVAMGKPIFLPATVKGILAIIKNIQHPIEGANVVVVGASNIVGKPLAIHLSNLGATVAVCRSRTKNLSNFTRKADILVSATGVPKLIKKEMVKKGAVVIDAGSPRGDVFFEEVKKVASFITPVPGGVGPLTVICLLENVLVAARNLV